jgi:RNA 2',3'-cyclic 3'-phosphodiesterase
MWRMPAHPPPHLRLFTALWPDECVRNALAAWQQAWEWPRQAALVKPERMHMTLHFLGDVATHRLPELVAQLQIGFTPFSLEIDATEVWSQGVAVLRPQHTPRALQTLHRELSVAVEGFGIPLDPRPFRAHVTLARRAQGARCLAPAQSLRWPVRDGYALVRTLPGGAGYETLARFT